MGIGVFFKSTKDSHQITVIQDGGPGQIYALRVGDVLVSATNGKKTADLGIE